MSIVEEIFAEIDPIFEVLEQRKAAMLEKAKEDYRTYSLALTLPVQIGTITVMIELRGRDLDALVIGPDINGQSQAYKIEQNQYFPIDEMGEYKDSTIHPHDVLFVHAYRSNKHIQLAN
jgi:hypothetical protein